MSKHKHTEYPSADNKNEVNEVFSTKGKNDRYQGAIKAIIWSVVVIILLDLLCIVAIIGLGYFMRFCNAKEILNSAQERTLLSTGLSLIGIAISVWATLNIINVLDKREIGELNNQVTQFTKEYQKLLSEYEEKYDTEIERMKEQSRNIFLYHIEQNACDYSMAYIAKKFVDMEDVPYSQLSIVMLYYSRVYQLHSQQADDNSISIIAKRGVDYTKYLLNQNQNYSPNVKMFLHFCLAELHFYWAYCYRGVERYKHSMQAIEEYDKAKDLFGVSIPEYNPNAVCTNPDKIDIIPNCDNPVLLAYWCNTYGECYSKAVQGYNYDNAVTVEASKIETMRKEAVFYCGYAVRLSSSKNQTYLRNFGCALEAAYGKKAFEELIAKDIAAVYQKAMDICISSNHIPYKVFYTWLSFYHKYTDHKMNMLPDSQSEIQLPGRIEVSADDLLCKYFDQALAYSELAYKTYPDKIVFLKLHAFVVRDLCIFEITCNGKTELASEYYTKLTQIMQTLEILCVNNYDDFMKQLTAWQDHLSQVGLK